MADRNGKRGAREVVVVTGASAGVGRAIIREFARHGTAVGLLARGRDGLEGARRAMAASDFLRVTEVTYLGTVHGTMTALRRRRPRDRGVVVQIGSALAYRAIPLQSAYCAAKHALQGFTESLRSELIHDRSHVHLTTVQLPAVNTPQLSWIKTRLPCHPQPVPPIYQPEVIARAVYWAAHHRRREFSVGYPTVEAIVGDTFIPGLLDHYLAWVGYDSQRRKNPSTPTGRTTSTSRFPEITALMDDSMRAPSRSACNHGRIAIEAGWVPPHSGWRHGHGHRATPHNE